MRCKADSGCEWMGPTLCLRCRVGIGVERIGLKLRHGAGISERDDVVCNYASMIKKQAIIIFIYIIQEVLLLTMFLPYKFNLLTRLSFGVLCICLNGCYGTEP